MTDLLFQTDGEVFAEPKLRVNHHGWVEHYDESGSILGLTPPHKVETVIVGAERFHELESECEEGGLATLLDLNEDDEEVETA